ALLLDRGDLSGKVRGPTFPPAHPLAENGTRRRAAAGWIRTQSNFRDMPESSLTRTCSIRVRNSRAVARLGAPDAREAGCRSSAWPGRWSTASRASPAARCPPCRTRSRGCRAAPASSEPAGGVAGQMGHRVPFGGASPGGVLLDLEQKGAEGFGGDGVRRLHLPGPVA